MRTWTTLLRVDGGNLFVNRAALAMLQAQVAVGHGPAYRIIEPKEAVTC